MPYTPCGYTCSKCGAQCNNNLGHENYGASHSCGHR
jgi:hypothetical protein